MNPIRSVPTGDRKPPCGFHGPSSAPQAAERLPVLKWIINPFFAYPHHEVTAIPINVSLPAPESVPLPRRLVERVIREASDIFILDECICRGKLDCANHPKTIGCMALGDAIDRMHPSHGRRPRPRRHSNTSEKPPTPGCGQHAMVWIDPQAFNAHAIQPLMFIVICYDCCCPTDTHETAPDLTRQGLSAAPRYRSRSTPPPATDANLRRKVYRGGDTMETANR